MNNLEALIGRACGQLTQRAANGTGTADHDMGGLMFFGNPMETTPRRLLLDDRLSPVDKLGWMAFRMSAAQDREMSFPSYDTLQRLLSSRADGANASRSTVNRVVFILRLTRWLTLCHQARNTHNGRMIGNIYALHDEPVAVVDSTRLDAGYLGFVNKCRTHGNQSVRKVAAIVFEELAADQRLRYMMTQMGMFKERLKDHNLARQKPQRKAGGQASRAKTDTRDAAPETKFKLSGIEIRTHGNSPEFDSVRPPGTNSNSVDSAGQSPAVRNSNSYTVRTLQNTACKSVRTAPADAPAYDSGPALDWSKLTLRADEKTTITHHLRRLPPELHQNVLDEAAARSNGIRNMTGYLLGLIEKANRGELKITQIQLAAPSRKADPPQYRRQEANTPAPSKPRNDFAPADVSALLRGISQSLRPDSTEGHPTGETPS